MKTNVNKGFFIFLSQRQLTTSGSPLILFVKLVPLTLYKIESNAAFLVFPFPIKWKYHRRKHVTIATATSCKSFWLSNLNLSFSSRSACVCIMIGCISKVLKTRVNLSFVTLLSLCKLTASGSPLILILYCKFNSRSYAAFLFSAAIGWKHNRMEHATPRNSFLTSPQVVLVLKGWPKLS